MSGRKIFITGFSTKNKSSKRKLINNFVKKNDCSKLPQLKKEELVKAVLERNKKLYFSDEDDIQLLNDEKDYKSIHLLPTGSRIGIQGYKTYFGKYKFLNQAKKNPPLRNSATIKYLRTLDSLNQIPEPMGIVKRYGDISEINIE